MTACASIKNNFSIHKIECKWAEAFNNKYRTGRDPTEEEKTSGTWTICCCPPPLVPHNEAEKFKLLKAQEGPEKPMFSGNEVREINEIQGIEMALRPPIIDIKISMRGSETKEILEKLAGNTRILIFYGATNIGKSLLIKHLSNYAYERKLFKNGVVYIDMKGKRFCKSINRILAKKLNSPWEKSNEHLAKLIDNMHIFIIIDNLDSFEGAQLDDLKTKISIFHEKTQFPKFCIVTEHKFVVKHAEYYELKPFSKSTVGRLFKANLDDARYRQERDNIQKVVQKIDCSPINVFKLINKFKEKPLGQSLDQSQLREFEREINRSQGNVKTENEQLSLALIYFRERSPEALNFLQLISDFPSGIYKNHLKFLCESKPYDYEEILVLINSQQSWLLECSDDIIKVNEVFNKYIKENYQGFIETRFYEYLSLVIQSIYVELKEQPQVQCMDLLKSFTNLHFWPYPMISSSDKESFLHKSPIEIFNEMKNNFSVAFTKETIMRVRKSDINTVFEYIFQICVYNVRVYLIQRKQKKAEDIIRNCNGCQRSVIRDQGSSGSGAFDAGWLLPDRFSNPPPPISISKYLKAKDLRRGCFRK